MYETLIMPAMERFTNFRMNPRGYLHKPGSISNQLISEILEADLVIADLTELSPSGYYELGVRHAAQLPMVLIADAKHVIAVSAQDFQLVRYQAPSLLFLVALVGPRLPLLDLAKRSGKARTLFSKRLRY